MKTYLKNLLTLFMFCSAFDAAHCQPKAYNVWGLPMHNWGYPSFDTVVEYLSHRIRTDTMSSNTHLMLAKRKTGYYFYIADVSQPLLSLGHEQKCWDRASSKFVYDSGYFNAEPDSAQSRSFYDRWYQKDNKYFYTDILYYGYEGWTYDVMSQLEHQAVCSDEDLYALYRAYTLHDAYLYGPLWDYDIDYLPRSSNFHLGDFPGRMTSAELDTFHKYNGKARAVCRRLMKQNPNFLTGIGNIYLKYSNEVICAFQELAYLQNEETALKEAPHEELYDPVTLVFAHNMLMSCDSGGILFTDADNDTYPLYYLQLSKGERRDVLVVNKQLLSLPIYTNAMRKGLFGTAGIPMRLKPSEYAKEKIAGYIKADDPRYAGFTTIQGIPKHIEKEKFDVNEWVLVDILNANEWKRPIYFSAGFQKETFLGLDDYVRSHGFVYQLQTKAGIGGKPDEMLMDMDFSYDLFINRMSTIDWAKQQHQDKVTVGMVSNPMRAMYRCADILIRSGETNKAMALLEKMQLAYAGAKTLDVYFTFFPEIYYQHGDKDKALSIAQKVILWGNENYELKKKEDAAPSVWLQDVQYGLYFLQQMLAFYNAHSEYSSQAADLKKVFDSKLNEYADLARKKGL